MFKTILSGIVKGLQADDLPIPYKYDEYVLFLEKNKQSYNLGRSGDRVVVKDNLTTTSLSAAAVATDTTITVASASGILDGQYRRSLPRPNNLIDNSKRIACWNHNYLTDAMTRRPPAQQQSMFSRIRLPGRYQLRVRAYRFPPRMKLLFMLVAGKITFMLSNKAATGVTTQIYYNPRLGNGKPMCGQRLPTKASIST